MEDSVQVIEFDDAPHFKPEEFARVGCLKSDCDPAALRRLERLRTLVGRPLILTSAFRTPYHERLRGRSGTGPHTFGCAFDLACTSDELRYLIVSCAIQCGFTRIGIGKNFVHVDCSNVHRAQRIWTYYK